MERLQNQEEDLQNIKELINMKILPKAYRILNLKNRLWVGFYFFLCGVSMGVGFAIIYFAVVYNL